LLEAICKSTIFPRRRRKVTSLIGHAHPNEQFSP
jgi:hypothetical protein